MIAEKIMRDATSKPAIVVRGVSKKFIIPHERRTTLFENIKGVFNPSTYETFTALKNVDLVVERGESIGIIGDNGSGKSTLLKIIAKILRPTSGSVDINGKITPFLELGVGFQPDLTAKENIEVYSTIMGLSGREIAANMDSVLEFAGLTKFKDTKLKNFSSGMQVRLAFATAIQTTPDILLVDEVLAVGDMDFQQKCLDIFNDYRKKGITIVFVSHDLSSVRRFCDRVMLLKNGEQVALGKTAEVIDRYIYGSDVSATSQETHGSVAAEAQGQQAPSVGAVSPVAVPEQKGRWGSRKVAITGVALLDKFGNKGERYNVGDPLRVRIFYHTDEPVDDCVFGIAIYNDQDALCSGTNTDIDEVNLGNISGDGAIEIIIPAIPFLYGKFTITVAAHAKDNTPYDWIDKMHSFTVINTGHKIGLVELNNTWSHIDLAGIRN